MLVLCYYAIFGFVSLSYLSVTSANLNNYFLALQKYFVCEAVGSGMECDRSGFDYFGYHGLIVLVYLMLGLIPAVNLTFVVNWTAAKELCKHNWMKYFQEVFTHRANADKRNRTVDTVETNV